MSRKPKAYVLDTWTIIAYLQDEPAAEKIVDLIADAHAQEIPLYMSVVNACEVWYILAREVSESEADSSITDLMQLGIQFQDVNWESAKEAAKFKAKGKMSLGDCFAAGLAREQKADLVTGDPEFKQVETQIKIQWL
ncbi:MAG: type II toxin-antitoxin system VapC family toxin [Chloroflexi bacterium]|nr:type II toxin-antitoxin system VapC family toxin [Chloroflexota bacterium]